MLGAGVVILLIIILGIPSRKTGALQNAAAGAQAPAATGSPRAEAAAPLQTDTPSITTDRSSIASAKSPAYSSTKLTSHSSPLPRLSTEPAPAKEQPLIVPTSPLELAVPHQFKKST